MRFLVCLTVFVSCLAFGQAAHADVQKERAPFRVTSGASMPLSDADGAGFYNHVVAELFKRMGMPHVYLSLPPTRSLDHVNKGIDDANIARVEGIEKKWTNLIRVPEPVVTWEFTAYTNTLDIPVQGWDTFKPYAVGIIRGWQIYEKNLATVEGLTPVTSAEQLFALLKAGRIDVAMYERSQAAYWLKGQTEKPRAMNPPVATLPLYLYVHKKHAGLVPTLTDVLRSMREDGTLARLYKEILVDVQ